MSDKSEELEKQVADEAEIFEGTPAGLVLSKAAAELRAQREEIARLEIEEDSNKAALRAIQEFYGELYDDWQQAQVDRDHWEEEAAKNHSQTLEAMQENDRLREKLRAVLPMAKGYASKNNVGRNREKIEEAEVILGNRIETASKRILRDPSRSKKSKTNFSKSLSQALPRALKETSGDQDGS